VESGMARILTGSGNVDAIGTRPIDRPEAHRAGLARGVDLASFELEASQRPARLAYGDDLGMSRRIVAEGHGVSPLGDDRIAPHDHGSERPPLGRANIPQRKVDCAPHES